MELAGTTRSVCSLKQGGGHPARVPPNAAAAGVVWTQHRPLAASQVSELRPAALG